ncbi:exopolysaccharide biosynthesis protein [Lactobacillus sp. LC28-10]|uniref:Capsular polysaccharide biosynthesis protein CpsC n=1 Tax=Secundilactobacillus angelensis TaxID=2722706 RepID=A0ABX1KZB1_9LACO|nr:Wzz/FepE/Etk N-terminal domain-containing protein [Secundilactobacillus angelensis]MCH5463425.1 Wzz/FepE/Etk N-terminal domain-containing protein [Secundilactobacillus angelensis]NLR18318.1 exopolysaccharide biosynthesis protein [Secundilactobacillus angelensis]
MESTLDLQKMFGILRKHLVFIIVATIGFGIIAFGVAELAMTPKYTSTTQLLVNQKDNNNPALALQNQQADVQMVSTYKDIVTNQVILHQVQKNLTHPEKVVRKATKAVYRTSATTGRRVLVRAAKPAIYKSSGRAYQVSVAELQDAISVSNQQNSQVFAINVKTDDPNKSAAVANQVASVFTSKIKSMMRVNNVTTVSKATANYGKTSPNTKLIVLLGLVVGLLIGMGYAFIKELTDTTVKEDDFLQDELGLTNLGHIATIKMSNSKGMIQSQSTQSESRSKRVRV